MKRLKAVMRGMGSCWYPVRADFLPRYEVCG
jgi:hypothetical protein